MQNEITELRKQVRTLKRIVYGLLICALLSLNLTGCTTTKSKNIISTDSSREANKEKQNYAGGKIIDTFSSSIKAMKTDRLRVGLNDKEVRVLYGDPDKIERSKGMEIWSYGPNDLKFAILDSGLELRFWSFCNVYYYSTRTSFKKNNAFNLFNVPEFQDENWGEKAYGGDNVLVAKHIGAQSWYSDIPVGCTPMEIIQLCGVPDVFDLDWNGEISYEELISDSDTKASFTVAYLFKPKSRNENLMHANSLVFYFKFSNMYEMPRCKSYSSSGGGAGGIWWLPPTFNDPFSSPSGWKDEGFNEGGENGEDTNEEDSGKTIKGGWG
jgi:hypothetical protein